MWTRRRGVKSAWRRYRKARLCPTQSDSQTGVAPVRGVIVLVDPVAAYAADKVIQTPHGAKLKSRLKAHKLFLEEEHARAIRHHNIPRLHCRETKLADDEDEARLNYFRAATVNSRESDGKGGLRQANMEN
ncbi:hypothetical protein EYF80_048225 [Liparis tanakae]|uniref:Uncharacterized protein n=1 Tax=Liparis tanakae TaxID=230148 RepID=A0A4Z2FL38_9TELE|nr:hypothetical protein EYF80_048225 [Liparis tanakae]